MLEDVMEAVTGRRYGSEPARLEGHSRYRLRGLQYPGMVPEAGGVTEGRIYRQLTRRHLQRLDRFEGGGYRRISVMVTVAGASTPAEAYVLAPEMRSLLTRREWDLESFRERDLEEFLRTYAGFKSG